MQRPGLRFRHIIRPIIQYAGRIAKHRERNPSGTRILQNGVDADVP
jgi:hypothetical protein